MFCLFPVRAKFVDYYNYGNTLTLTKLIKTQKITDTTYVQYWKSTLYLNKERIFNTKGGKKDTNWVKRFLNETPNCVTAYYDRLSSNISLTWLARPRYTLVETETRRRCENCYQFPSSKIKYDARKKKTWEGGERSTDHHDRTDWRSLS